MEKQIITKPEAIRSAGSNISGLDTTNTYSKFPTVLSSSDGLTAEGVNEIINELEIIEGLVNVILKQLPKKLEDVASIFEEYDEAIAKQFK